MFASKIFKKRRAYLPVLTLSLLLSFLGLIAIYNASVVEGFTDFGDKFYFAKQQFVWLIIALLVFFVVSQIKPIFFKHYASYIFGFSVLLMLLVLIPGFTPKLQGARRWLVFNSIVIQPSEIFKISLIIYLSSWLEKPKESKLFFAIITFSLALVMLQPDLGTAIIIAVSAFVLYYLSGVKIINIALPLAILTVIGSLLVISSPYRMRRISSYLNPESDPQGASYHINQVLLGLGSGGFLGVGPGRSRQKYAYLPESTTDSIFVIIAEELGFAGALVLISLFLVLSILAFKIASQAKNLHQQLLASGIALLLLLQIFVNLGAMVALLPITGVPLPLISYGGSSLVSTFAALGILVSISKTS